MGHIMLAQTLGRCKQRIIGMAVRDLALCSTLRVSEDNFAHLLNQKSVSH